MSNKKFITLQNGQFKLAEIQPVIVPTSDLIGSNNQIFVNNSISNTAKDVIFGNNDVILSLAQDIATSSTPTFSQIVLGSSGNSTNNAVRADYTIYFTSSIDNITVSPNSSNLTNNFTMSIGWSGLLNIDKGGTNKNLSSYTIGSILYKDNDSISAIQNINDTTNKIILYQSGSIPKLSQTTYLDTISSHSIIYSSQENILSSSTYTNEGLLYISNNIPTSSNKLIFNENTNTLTIGDDSNTNIIISGKGFASGFTGYGYRLEDSIENKSKLQLDNLTVRGTMNVYELLINQIRATNGSLFVSSATKFTDGELISGNVGQINSVYTFKSQPETYVTFATNDIIRCQRIQPKSSTNTIIYRYDFIVLDSTDISCNCKLIYVSNEVQEVQQFLNKQYIRLGNIDNINRQGNIYLTSDDSNSPFIDIVDGISSSNDWNTSGKVKVRLGKLDGIYDSQIQSSNLSGYGLYAVDNVYLKGTIFANSGSIAGWNINSQSLSKNNIHLDSDNQKIYIGTDGAYTSSNTSFYVDGLGKFSLKDKLYFDGNDLNISGNITSSAGLIGGWSITTSSIYKNNIHLDSENQKIYIGTGTYNDTNTSFYVDSIGQFSLGDSLTFNNNILSISGSIIADTGSIAGWNISNQYLYKDRVSLSTNSSYWNSAQVIPTASSNISISNNFNKQDIEYYIGWSGFSLFTNLIDQTKLKYNDTISIQFKYSISRSETSGLIGTGVINGIYPILQMVDGDGQPIGSSGKEQYTYKLFYMQQGQEYHIRYDYNITRNSQDLKFKIFFNTINETDTGLYTISINPIVVSKYEPKIELSNKGLMIFNSPSNYTKLGYVQHSQDIFTPVTIFKGQQIQVQSLTIYDSFYNYGDSYISADDLLGTTAGKFTINSQYKHKDSELIFNSRTQDDYQSFNASIKFNTQQLIFDKPINVTQGGIKNTNLNGIIYVDDSGTFVGSASHSMLSGLGISQTQYPTNININQYITSITKDNTGHISSITTGSVDLSHNHNVKVGSTTNSIGVGQTLEFAGSGLTSVSINNKKITISSSNKTLTIGGGLSGVSYDGTSAKTISHSIATGNITNGTGSSVIQSISRDSYGHITSSSIIDLHTLFNTSFPLSSSILNSVKTISILYDNINIITSSNKLTTIQNITTTSTPTFKQLNLKLDNTNITNLSTTTNGLYIDKSIITTGYIEFENGNDISGKWCVNNNNIVFTVQCKRS